MVTRDVIFLSPRLLRGPSVDRRVSLPRDQNLPEFYNASPKIRGTITQKWGQKCKISVDFTQPQTLIVNISGMSQGIENQKDT